jgi:hypothetical protein
VARRPRPWTPPPEPPSASTRRRISTSDGTYAADSEGNFLHWLPDSGSPAYERIVAADAAPEEPEA